MAARSKTSVAVILGVGLLVLLIALVASFKYLAKNDIETQRNQPLSASNDQPTESLTALSAQITRMKKVSARKENEQNAQVEQLRQQNVDLQRSIDRSGSNLLSELQSKFDSLNQRIADSNVPQYEVTQPTVPQNGELRQDGRIWFGGASLGSTNQSDVALLTDRLGLGSIDEFGIQSTAGGNQTENAALPVYTIPSEATLVNSRGLTAIIGRVPLNGVVKEPIPFKVITGSDNLVPNGLELPEIEKAIWSGVAIGDATLECVTGRLNSVTFVFADGTISTFPGGEGNLTDQGIAWISDQRGYPCIPGTFVSNAPEVMAKMFGAGFSAGAANAFAQANTETTQFTSGGTSTIVTGDTGAYAAAQGAAAGFNEWSRYIAERARDLFDAVVVHPGRTVTIHTNHYIPVDYQTQGRRIRHVAANPDLDATGGLD